MPAEEIGFRVAFEGPLTEFSRRNPGATISLWCNWEREVIEIANASREEVDRLQAALRAHAPDAEQYAIGERTHVIVQTCVGLPHDFVYEAADEARCLAVPPTRFEGGWEYYDVVSFDEENARTLFKRIREKDREVELLSKRAMRAQLLLNARDVGVNALFAGLTEKQVEALLLAFKHGLYASPKRVTAAQIAEARGLSRSTFEEHIRKAENKLVANLVPYLELFAKAKKPG